MTQDEKIQLGEMYLIYLGLVELGTRPGTLDIWLGAQDQRSRLEKNGSQKRRIDINSHEYKQKCLRYYNHLILNLEDEKLEDKIHTIQNYFKKQNHTAKQEFDKINWSSIITHSLMLSANITSQISPFISTPPAPSIETTNTNNIDWLNSIATYVTLALGPRPYNIAALALLSPRIGESVEIENENYHTTMVCGPKTHCESFRESNDIDLINVKGDAITKIPYDLSSKTNRLILHGHGSAREDGSIIINDFNDTQVITKPDVFAKKFFANTIITHVLACGIGEKAKEHFSHNVLNPNDILMLYSDEEQINAAMALDSITYLTTSPNHAFAIPQNIKIIFKQDDSTTIFSEITPYNVDIKTILDNSTDEAELINTLFEEITHNINQQTSNVLTQLQHIPQKSRNIIQTELSRLGYKDHSQETDFETRKEWVKESVTRLLLLQTDISEQHFEILTTQLQKLIHHNIIDINYQSLSGATPAIIRTAVKSDKDVKIFTLLLQNGAHLENSFSSLKRSPAHIAVISSNIKILEVMHHHNMSLSPQDIEQNTPLHLAADHGENEIIKFLLNHNVDVNALNIYDHAPLHYAINRGHLKSCEILIQHHSAINQPNNDGLFPIHLATKNNQPQIVKLLIKHNCNINALTHPIGKSAAGIAIDNKNYDILQLLMDNNIDLELAQNDGYKAIHGATWNGDVKALRIVATKQDVNNIAHINGNAITPLIIAIQKYNHAQTKEAKKNYKNFIQSLLEIGADPELPGAVKTAYELTKDNKKFSAWIKKHRQNYHNNNTNPNIYDKEGWNPLLLAASKNDKKQVATLLQHPLIDPNPKYLDWTPLTFAITNMNNDIIDLLLQHPNTNVNMADNHNIPLIGRAIFNNDATTISKLLAHPNINKTIKIGNNEQTPLLYSAEQNKIQATQALLNSGVNPNEKNAQDWTPLNIAIQFNNIETVNLLLEDKNIKVNLATQSWTPLMMATGNKAILEKLLDKNVDLTQRNNEGDTALDIAKKKGNPDIIEILNKAQQLRNKPSTPEATQLNETITQRIMPM